MYESYHDPECSGVYFIINVLKKGFYSLHVDKTPERSIIDCSSNDRYIYPVGELGLRKVDGVRSIVYQGLISKRRSLFRSYELIPGKYVAFVRIKYNRSQEKDFEVNLAVYSEYACEISIATTEDAQLY